VSQLNGRNREVERDKNSTGHSGAGKDAKNAKGVFYCPAVRLG